MTTKQEIYNYVKNYGGNDIHLIEPKKIYAKIMSIGIMDLDEKIFYTKKYENDFMGWPIEKQIEFDRTLLNACKGIK